MLANQLTGAYLGLKSILVKKQVKQIEVANEIHMPVSTFNLKINRKNGRDFTLSEANAIAEYLGEDIENFF